MERLTRRAAFFREEEVSRMELLTRRAAFFREEEVRVRFAYLAGYCGVAPYWPDGSRL